MSLQTLTNFNGVLNVLSDNVRTDIPFGELNALRSDYQEAARNMDRLTLEGPDQRLDDGLWYFLPNDESYNELRRELRENLELE